MKIQQQVQAKINKVGAKNLFQSLSGLVLIVLTFLLNGFLSFVIVGFDWHRILTGEYWANFGLMSASEIIVMYGMYLIQRTKDISHKKITDLQNEITKQREVVYGLDKVTEAEDWLKDIYNYKQRLLIYERKVKTLYDRLRLYKPQEDENNYARKLEKYEKQVLKKQFLQKQLEYIKIDKKRIKMLVSNAPEEEVNKIEKQLDVDEYGFKTAKIKYREVYWGNLLSDLESQSKKDSTPFFNEKTELSKTVTKTIGIGCVFSSFISALTTLGVTRLDWSFWLGLILKSVILLMFLIRGIMLSKSIILDKYYKSLEKRKSIYVAMLKDLGLSKIIFEGNENEQKSS